MSVDLVATHGAMNGRSYEGAMMEKGKAGESIVWRWLQDHPEVIDVDDLRELRQMQKADVDFAIYNEDGTVYLAEVKSDQYLRMGGNVTFEFMRINHTAPHDKACVLGWTARTPARFVMFYASSEQHVYVFTTLVLRRMMQRFTQNKRPSRGEWINALPEMKMRWVSTDAIKSTLCFFIPLSEFKPTEYKRYDVSAYV